MNPETADAGQIVLSARRICKSFSGVQVLFSVNFDLRSGEIHALMGENGAGKSEDHGFAQSSDFGDLCPCPRGEGAFDFRQR